MKEFIVEVAAGLHLVESLEEAQQVAGNSPATVYRTTAVARIEVRPVLVMLNGAPAMVAAGPAAPLAAEPSSLQAEPLPETEKTARKPRKITVPPPSPVEVGAMLATVPATTVEAEAPTAAAATAVEFVGDRALEDTLLQAVAPTGSSIGLLAQAVFGEVRTLEQNQQLTRVMRDMRARGVLQSDPQELMWALPQSNAAAVQGVLAVEPPPVVKLRCDDVIVEGATVIVTMSNGTKYSRAMQGPRSAGTEAVLVRTTLDHGTPVSEALAEYKVA